MFKCTSCDSTWETAAHLALNGCKFCNIQHRAASRKKYTAKEFDATLPAAVKRISHYETLSTKCTFKCKCCSFEWTCRARRGRRGCPRCNKTAQNQASRKTEEAFLFDLAATHGDSIEAMCNYTRSGTRMQFRHVLCGHIWWALPANILRGRGCPKCKLRMEEATLGERKVLVRGYEGKALTYMKTLFKPSQINVHNEKTVPNFAYRFRGSNRSYFPDMYLPHINTIVEVKSVSTIGLTGNFFQKKPQELFYMTRAKALAVLEQGYKFKLLLMSAKGVVPIKVPKNWHELNYREFKESVLHDLPLG